MKKFNLIRLINPELVILKLRELEWEEGLTENVGERERESSEMELEKG